MLERLLSILPGRTYTLGPEQRKLATQESALYMRDPANAPKDLAIKEFYAEKNNRFF